MAKGPSKSRVERLAERAAARAATEDAWRAQVDAHFQYLWTEYGYRITQVDASSVWVTRLVYESGVGAIYIDRSVEFDRIEVSLVRLVDGKLPEYPIFITPDTTINLTLLDNLLEVRAPHFLPTMRAMAGLKDEQIEHALAFLAHVLKEQADDVLRGDFAVFMAIEQLIKQRVKEHPQVITVWVPEGTTPEEMDRLAEETRQQNPTQPVEVRQYRRPPTRRKRKTSLPENESST